MMPSSFDDNQQLTTYVSALRQLLEPLTNVTGSLPAPSVPSLLPPAPADYSQQLFSYLQAWRQYLENAVGSPPASESPQPPHRNKSDSPPAHSRAAMAPAPAANRQNAIDPWGGGQIGDPSKYEDLVTSPEPRHHRDTAPAPPAPPTPPTPPTPPSHQPGQNERGSTRLPTDVGPSLYSSSAASGATSAAAPQEIIKMSRNTLVGSERAADLQPSAPGGLQNAKKGDGTMGSDREFSVVAVGPVIDLSKYNLSPALHEDRSFVTSNDLGSLYQTPPASTETSSTAWHFGTAHTRISDAVTQHDKGDHQPQ